MNNAFERFKDNFENWNDVLRYLTEESANLQDRIAVVLKTGNVALRPGLERYKDRFESQDQVILLLRQQLDELIKKATPSGNDIENLPADIDEQLVGFKVDMDRVVLLFSRLRLQFNRFIMEHLA